MPKVKPSAAKVGKEDDDDGDDDDYSPTASLQRKERWIRQIMLVDDLITLLAQDEKMLKFTNHDDLQGSAGESTGPSSSSSSEDDADEVSIIISVIIVIFVVIVIQWG